MTKRIALALAAIAVVIIALLIGPALYVEAWTWFTPLTTGPAR